MPAIRVNSPSFSFAPCVCLPATRVDSSQSLHACDLVRALCLMPEIDLRRLQNQPSEARKSSPDRPGTSRSGPERHKSVPSASKERPRASQKRLKSGQDSPKSSQERPKSAPRAPQEPLKIAPRRAESPLRTILRAQSCEKVTFEGDPSCDSVEKCVWNDFLSIFASCAQERMREKPAKTQ